jgi:probable dihydroxyacetone kinase regulator
MTLQGAIMSELTQKALATSLKELLETKPLDKIRVKEITDKCGVNRQTFYYHFTDIFDLVEWIYQKETAKAIADNKTYDTWQQGFKGLMEWAIENKSFVLNIYNSISRDYLENYLYSQTFRLLYAVINDKAQNIISEESKVFIADFYKFSFVGLALQWIGAGMKQNPDEIIRKLDKMIHGDITEAIERFRAA